MCEQTLNVNGKVYVLQNEKHEALVQSVWRERNIFRGYLETLQRLESYKDRLAESERIREELIKDINKIIRGMNATRD